jgi:hypothetical protein
MTAVLQRALVTMCGGAGPTEALQGLLDQHAQRRSLSDVQVRERVLATVRGWARPSGKAPAVRRPPSTRDRATSSNQAVQPLSPLGSQSQLNAPAFDVMDVDVQPVAPGSPMASNGQSLYLPPGSDAGMSAGYQSYGDTDDLGSVGQLLQDDDAGVPLASE